MSKQKKSLLFAFIVCSLILGLPYLWRKYRDNDIKENSKYTFGKVIKKTNSLKNGKRWHYDFYFENVLYNGRWPTHVDYDVKMGDYFIVNFSSKNPEHNKILYDYKLKAYLPEVVNQAWDTIPLSIVESARK